MEYSWVLPLISLFVGLAGGVMGAYVGMKVGLVRLEVYVEHAREDIAKLRASSGRWAEDVNMHEVELEDVMRKLELPRKRRQQWRFDA